MNNFDKVSFSIPDLISAYSEGVLTPRDVIHGLGQRIAASHHNAWLRLLSDEEIEPYLKRLEGVAVDSLPLFGIPFGIKDNIDLVGIPTSAGYASGQYVPSQSAEVVQKLIDAGAIPIGKTNMDQFATGLVGTRTESESSVCRNALNDAIISGGSSSGSAVAVALAHVSFALGTDTAGSGRVPAALNNVFGLKPSPGLLSTEGVVPACPSLDCVSIFSQTASDANALFDLTCGFHERNSWSKKNSFSNGPRYFSNSVGQWRIAYPSDQDVHFEKTSYRKAFQFAQSVIAQIGLEAAEIDYEVFNKTAAMLYQGPWVNDRLDSIRAMIGDDLSSIHPVVREIVYSQTHMSVSDTMHFMHQLEANKQTAKAFFEDFDILIVPTIEDHFAIEEVLNDPIRLNSVLGKHTNFVNLLNLCAVSVPVSLLPDDVGFAVTLIAPDKRDKELLSLAASIETVLQLNPGACLPMPSRGDSKKQPYHRVDIVVCGAHLDGLPLNWQLRERGAKLVETTTSAPKYALYALSGGPIPRPAMVRDLNQGCSIAVEVWSIPSQELGSFLSEIPSPLGLGQVELHDGRYVTGFICEHNGIADALNISEFGGWKAWLSSKQTGE